VKNVSFAFSEAFIRGRIRFSFTSQKFSPSASSVSPPLKRITTFIESPSSLSASGEGDSISVYSLKEDLLVSERNEDVLDIRFNIY
jgi:hypothetical protein